MATPLDPSDQYRTCDVCYHRFTNRDPRYLKCHHAFCLQCLKNILAKPLTDDAPDVKTSENNAPDDVPGENMIRCPTCLEVTKLSSSGLEDLEPYFKNETESGLSLPGPPAKPGGAIQELWHQKHIAIPDNIIIGSITSLDFLANGDLISVGGPIQQHRIKVFDINGVEKDPPFDVSLLEDPYRVSVHRETNTVGFIDYGKKTVRLYTHSNNGWNTHLMGLDTAPSIITFTPSRELILRLFNSGNFHKLYTYSKEGEQLHMEELSHVVKHLCVDPKGNILVTDHMNLYAYDSQFTKLFTIQGGDSIKQWMTSCGMKITLRVSLRRTLKECWQMCLTSSGHILIADRGKKALVFYSPRGKSIKKLLDMPEMFGGDLNFCFMALYQDMYLVIASDIGCDIKMFIINLDSKK